MLRARAGFTLIEIAVVLILMGIAGMIVYPEVKRMYDQARMESTARDVATFFKMAKNRALSRQMAMGVLVEPEARRLVLVEEDGTVDKKLTLWEEVEIAKVLSDKGKGKERAEESADADKPEAEEESSIFWFYPDGRSTGVTLLLKQKSGREYLLKTDVLTGVTRIYRKGDPEFDLKELRK